MSSVIITAAMAQEPAPRPLPAHVKLAEGFLPAAPSNAVTVEAAKVEPVMLPIEPARVRREPVLPCAYIRTLPVDPQQDTGILVKPAPEAKGPMPVMKPMPRCGER